MGRRAYMTRLALGRSPYEPLPQSDSHVSDEELQEHSVVDRESVGEASTAPNADIFSSYQQQYDSSGYPENPESQELTRQYRRAHNDILKTVGIYARDQAEGQSINSRLDSQRKPALEKSAVNAVVRENEVGLLVLSTDKSLLYLSNMCTSGLRHRLQAYRFYSGIPFTQILKAEWKHFGITKFLFAGAPAGLTYLILETFLLWASEELIVIITRRILRFSDSRNRKILERRLFHLCYLLQFIFLAPLEMFSTLQRLDLVPAWPVSPHFTSFIPLSLSWPNCMPALRDPFSFRSCAHAFASLVMSPLFIWGLMYWTRSLVSQKLYAYMRAGLPKPTKPDQYSFEAAKETPLDEETLPGLCPESSNEQPSNSILEELARDLQYIGKTFIQFYDRWTGKEPPKPDRIQRSQGSSTDRPSLPDQQVLSAQFQPNERAANASPPTTNTGTPRPESPFSYPPTRPGTPGPTIELQTGSLVPANDNDHHTKTHELQHRVTALTAYAADSMASHLSTHLTDLLFLPLESMFIRSLAIAFLSSAIAGTEAQIAAMRWKREIFPVGAWFGMGLRGGGWRGVADYAGKMVLVSGMEVGIGMAVWQACAGFSWWCGRRYFGWGRL